MTDKIKKTYSALGSKSRGSIVVIMFVIVLASSIITAFAADPVITASGFTPAKGATASVAKPEVSVNVISAAANLNMSSVKAKIDGSNVAVSLNLKGHWETGYDSCSGYYEYWAVDSYREGTITLTSPQLGDGVHNVEVFVADINGNSLTETWSFNVDGPPAFTNLFPGPNSNVGNLTKISAVVSDPAGVDWNSVLLKIDGNAVQHRVDEASGTVTYDGVIADGNRTIYIEARDIQGNLGSKTWTFNNDSTKPVAGSWSPAKGSLVSVSNPKVSVYITDANTLNQSSLMAKIDGNAVPATLTYPGHMGSVYVDDGEEGGWAQVWITDSYKEGTVSFTAPALTDGVHEAEVDIADSRGNLLAEKWSFTVAAPPSFTSISPAAGSNQNNPAITAVLTDNSAIDWGTVVMKINNTAVAPEVYQETGTVTYKGGYPSGTVNVYIEAKDIAGNLGSKTWSFNNVVSGPQFRTCYYRTASSGLYGTVWPLTDGFTITNGTLWFDGYIDDTVKITSVTATLDGVPLNIQSTPPTYWTYRDDENDPGYLAYNDMRHVWYKYTGVIKDGDHTLVVTAKDEVGITTSLTRKIVVKSPPVISNAVPLQYGVTDLTPLISADVKDPNGTIVPESVVLTVDGTAVARNYDAIANKVTFQSGQLSDESYHTVALSVTDDFGLTSTKTWKFYTNAKSYPDMADSNINNCNICHTKYTTLQSHPLTFSGRHSSRDRCEECHKYISVVADCVQCHGIPGTEDEEWPGYAPHGSTPSIGYSATNYDTNFPLRIKTNREMFDCIICHQPGSNVLGHVGAYVQPTRLLNNHDIPELHKYTNESCNKCHAQSLTREHARPGRVDKNGQAINCRTCHQSTNPDIVSAIANNKKNCDACHKGASHEELHTWNSFDAKCQECHKNTLVAEHLSNEKTTGGKNYDCTTCHESTKKAVVRSIASSNINCAGCHQAGHGLLLADSAPLDIPKYPGYEWSNPLEASLFQGDPTAPAGYESGQVLISNRLPDITVDQVWSYYNEQADTKMSDKGWTLISGSLVPGASFFSAEYEKEGRFVTLKCYKSSLSDGTGPLGSGYRIEIWYK